MPVHVRLECMSVQRLGINDEMYGGPFGDTCTVTFAQKNLETVQLAQGPASHAAHHSLAQEKSPGCAPRRGRCRPG